VVHGVPPLAYFTMDTVGWGRAGTTVPEGAVSALPSLPFLSPIRARASFVSESRSTRGRDVVHLVIWSDRDRRITEKQPNQFPLAFYVGLGKDTFYLRPDRLETDSDRLRDFRSLK
jgi:hypothetical protein